MRFLKSLGFATLVASSLSAQTWSAGGDVIVGEITGVGNYGTNGSGIYAYSLGTDACNIGNASIPWSTSSNDHPVIAQHVYRLKPVAGQPYSRFEQIGMSWLKHGFAAVNGSTCTACVGGGGGLGVGCSDPYSSSLNGSQGNGPRSDVNATTGYFPYPSTSMPGAAATIGRRIQISAADVDPAQNAGALYWGECHYVTPTDALAGNGLNNASYRSMTFAATFNGTLSGATTRTLPAIYAWQAQDPQVQITTVDVADDGRFTVAKRVTSLGGGNYHYEFVIHNLNSDRSASGFNVDWPAGTVITAAGFRSIPYHSGEAYNNIPWPAAVNGSSIHWGATETVQQNVNANALRWGTSCNFWCNATSAAETNRTIELFKPAPCPADPAVIPPGNYSLDTNAAFDNPTLTAPIAGPASDDSSVAAPIGFSFLFYGVSYTTVNVCSNGFLQFNGSNTTYTNACIPSAAVPNNFVAGYWDDLNPGSGGSVTYQTLGVAPNRRFVAWWNNVPHYGGGGSASFKIILDEGTNRITSSIISSGNGGSGCTRGVENATGGAGTQASCGQPSSAVANTSQTYTWNTSVIPSANLTVTGSTGPNGVLTWSVNSNAHGAPVVLIASLDPGPTNLGALGVIYLGLTPGLYAVIADGAGALGAPNPAHVTDGNCGDFQISLPLGSGGLPPGLTIYNQGAVMGPSSNPPPPNGQFHITTPVTITT